MSLSELGWTISASLAGAVAIGWIAHWVWCLFSRATSGDRARIAHLVAELHAAEESRVAAERGLAATEAALRQRIVELETAMLAQASGYEAELAARAADQARLLREAAQEAEAAWDGLGLARRRIAELERDLSRH